MYIEKKHRHATVYWTFLGLKTYGFDGHSLVMAVVEVVWLEMVMVQVMVVEGLWSFSARVSA